MIRAFLQHPLIKLWLYLTFSTAVLLNPTFLHWCIYVLVFFILLHTEGISLHLIKKGLRPFIVFLPFMVGMYLIISLLFSMSMYKEIIIEILSTILKFGLIIAIMTLYNSAKRTGSVIQALRSLWVQLGIPWRKIEDMFLFMEITLRFYPAIQQDWDRWSKIHKALELQQTSSRVAHWKQTARGMPGMIMLHLRKADDVAQAMILRGYGQKIPRGIAYPVRFKMHHLLVMILIATVFFALHNIAAL